MAYVTSIDVRYRDLDRLGHVNNAVYATYFGQASMDYYEDVVNASPGDYETPLVHLEVDYVEQIELGDCPDVHVFVTELGTTSIRMEYEIRGDDELKATGETTQVYYDPRNETSRRIPDFWRERITEFEGW